jgi:lipoprotein-anchoring transpeptidase ErfK/SrfK
MTTSRILRVSLVRQEVALERSGHTPLVFQVSTAANGAGCAIDSGCTPTGRFRISEKIGASEAPGTIFTFRKPTGLWQPGDAVEGDLVLSRILRLDGLDPENANTIDRYIYFHGTNQEHLIGQPVSHGCIRLRNDDIIMLFDLVEVDDEVIIAED